MSSKYFIALLEAIAVLLLFVANAMAKSHDDVLIGVMYNDEIVVASSEQCRLLRADDCMDAQRMLSPSNFLAKCNHEILAECTNGYSFCEAFYNVFSVDNKKFVALSLVYARPSTALLRQFAILPNGTILFARKCEANERFVVENDSIPIDDSSIFGHKVGINVSNRWVLCSCGRLLIGIIVCILLGVIWFLVVRRCR